MSVFAKRPCCQALQHALWYVCKSLSCDAITCFPRGSPYFVTLTWPAAATSRTCCWSRSAGSRCAKCDVMSVHKPCFRIQVVETLQGNYLPEWHVALTPIRFREHRGIIDSLIYCVVPTSESLNYAIIAISYPHANADGSVHDGLAAVTFSGTVKLFSLQKVAPPAASSSSLFASHEKT